MAHAMKRLIFSAITVILVAGAVEAALWFGGVDTVLQHEDPFRGFSDLVRVFERDGDLYRTRPDDNHTFNDQAFLARKPEGGLRIFCLGGSSAFGFPWTAREAFSGVLRDVLRQALPDRSVEVVNAAGVSYGVHRLGLVAHELLEYEPDVFIIYSGHNEFVEPAFYEAMLERNRSLDRLTLLSSRSRVYSVLRRWAAAEPPDDDGDSLFGLRVERDQSTLFDDVEKQEIVSKFGEGLTALVAEAQAHGVAVVLVTVPCNLRDWKPQRSVSREALEGETLERWSRAIASGRRRLAAGDAHGALDALTTAVELSPQFAETHYLIGEAYAHLERWDDARSAFSRACDEDASPIRRTSAINAAIRRTAASRQTVLVDADRLFEERSAQGLVGLELIEDYVHPNLEGHRLIAWRLLDAMVTAGLLGGLERADRGLFDAVVGSRPAAAAANPVWLFNQGYLLENQGRLEHAAEKYREALEILPGYVDALRNLIRLYVAVGRDAEAALLTERLRRIAPDDTGGRMLHADALARDGDVTQAIEEYRGIALDRPDSPRVLNKLGALFIDAGRLDEALTTLTRSAELEPDNVAVQRYLGGVYDRLERYDSAVEHFRRAQELAPESAESYYNLGVVQSKLAHSTEAVRQLELAIELDPDYAAAHFNLGVVYLHQLRESEKAARHFREALRIDPTLAPARDNLARIERN